MIPCLSAQLRLLRQIIGRTTTVTRLVVPSPVLFVREPPDDFLDVQCYEKATEGSR